MFSQGMFSTDPDEQQSSGTDNGAPCDQEESSDAAAASAPTTTAVPLGLGFFARMDKMEGREVPEVDRKDDPPPLGMGFFSRIEKLEGDRAQRAAAKAQAAQTATGPTAPPVQGERGKTTNDEQTPIAPVSNQTLFGEGAPMPQFTSRDEAQELATLTAEEIAASEADVRGLTADMAGASIRDKENTALDELDAELDRYPDEEKAAYVEALRRCPDQVDSAHKKAFLWREEYDAKLAAKRIVRYWARRRTLFGHEKCYLPLTLTGALRGDELALETCTVRPLPVKDTRGRAIFYWSTSLFDPSRCSAESMLRACWYIFHVYAQDTDVRDRGFVMLVIPQGDNSVNGQTLFARFELGKRIMCLEIDVLPILFRGIHYCQPGMFFHLTNPIIKFFMGKRLRERFKVHYGSEEAMLKRLESYGMPPDRLPSELGGEILLRHEQWLASRFKEECRDESGISFSSTTETINDASPEDTKPSSAHSVYDPETVMSLGPEIGKQGTVHASTSVAKNDDISHATELEAESARRRRQRRQDQQIPIRSRNEDCTAKMPSAIPLVNGAGGEVTADKSASENSHGNFSLSDSLSSDQRMNTALSAKLMDPSMSSLQALVVGGYEFPTWEPGMTDRMLFDVENVSLYERKHELQIRLLVCSKDDGFKFGLGEASDASTSPTKQNCITSGTPKEQNELGRSWAVTNSSFLDPTPITGNSGVLTKAMNHPNIFVDASLNGEGRLPMAAKQDYSAIISVEDSPIEISRCSLNGARVGEDDVLKAPESLLHHLNCCQPPTNARIQAEGGEDSQDERLNAELCFLAELKNSSIKATGDSAYHSSKGISRADSFDSFDERIEEVVDDEGSQNTEQFNIDPIPINK